MKKTGLQPLQPLQPRVLKKLSPIVPKIQLKPLKIIKDKQLNNINKIINEKIKNHNHLYDYKKIKKTIKDLKTDDIFESSKDFIEFKTRKREQMEIEFLKDSIVDMYKVDTIQSVKAKYYEDGYYIVEIKKRINSNVICIYIGIRDISDYVSESNVALYQLFIGKDRKAVKYVYNNY